MTKALHQYDAMFYAYQREGSLRSARHVLPHLCRTLGPKSVLDVGCGAGAWLKVHEELGASEVLGIDGDYVGLTSLLIASDRFQPRNIAEPFDLGRRFDLVECLEVAEHVPARFADALIDNLTRHGSLILFSAAVPGQGGEDHINEQPLEYWRGRFAERGFMPFDFIRPLVLAEPDVESWYKFNTLVYVHDAAIGGLPEAVRATAVAQGEPVRELAPLSARLRRLVLRGLPQPAVTRLAKLKHGMTVAQLRKST